MRVLTKDYMKVHGCQPHSSPMRVWAFVFSNGDGFKAVGLWKDVKAVVQDIGRQKGLKSCKVLP